jgi:hypothetical protein
MYVLLLACMHQVLANGVGMHSLAPADSDTFPSQVK